MPRNEMKFIVILLLIAFLLGSCNLTSKEPNKLIGDGKFAQWAIADSNSICTSIDSTDICLYYAGQEVNGNSYVNNNAVIKYTQNGDLLWKKKIESAHPLSYSWMPMVCCNDNAVFALYDLFLTTEKKIDFGDGIVKNMLPSSGPILAMYNANGTCIWAALFTNFAPIAFSADKLGNVYLLGGAKGNCDFGPSTDGTASSGDYIIVKCNSNGVIEWAYNIRNSNSGGVLVLGKIKCDCNNNIVIEGSFLGTINLGNNQIIGPSKSNTSYAPVIAQYSGEGICNWAKTIEITKDAADINFRNLGADKSGNIIVVGDAHNGSFDFGNSITLSADLLGSAFVVKYNAQGLAQWINHADAKENSGYGITFSNVKSITDDNVYIVGRIGFGNYNFGNQVNVIGAIGIANDIFVKYSQVNGTKWVQVHSSIFNSPNPAISGNDAGTIYFAGNIGSGSNDLGNSIIANGPGSIAIQYK